MKTKFFVAVALLMSMASANAMLIRVSQETAAGAGDFDDNILGLIQVYETPLTIADFYSYSDPLIASYNGQDNGGPVPVSQMSQTFIVSGADGVALVMVHDSPNDVGGGSTVTRWNLFGDTAAELLADDPGEPVTVSAGGTQFDSTKNWIDCCTDGYAIGELDGAWSMIGQFLRVSGIGQWQATSADGQHIALLLNDGQRARFDTVPEPASLSLLGIGLLGLGFMRRRIAA